MWPCDIREEATAAGLEVENGLVLRRLELLTALVTMRYM